MVKKFIIFLIFILINSVIIAQTSNKDEVMDKLIEEAKSGLSEDQQSKKGNTDLDSIDLLRKEASKEKRVFNDLKILFNPGIIYFSDAIGYVIETDVFFNLRVLSKAIPDGLFTGLGINLYFANRNNSGIFNIKSGLIGGYYIPINISGFKFVLSPYLLTGLSFYNINVLNVYAPRTAFILVPKINFMYEIFRNFEIGFETGLEIGFGVYSRPLINVNSLLSVSYGFNFNR